MHFRSTARVPPCHIVRFVDGAKSPEGEAETKRAGEDLLRCHKMFMEEVSNFILGNSCGRPRGMDVSRILMGLTRWHAE